MSSIQGRRPYQEDQYAVCRFLKDPVNPPDVTPETHFFGVFDGHAGGKCSKAICSTIPYQLSRDESFITKLPLALRRAIQRTNDQFLEIAGKMRLNDGSTGVMVVLRGKTLVTANVGDSRAVLISGRKATALTDDHKPSLPSETRRIQSFGGNVTYNTGIARVAGVLAVSRAFGNFGLRNLIRADPDITQRDLVADDHFIVLASDGLWDVYRNAEVADICYSMEKQGAQRTADFLTQSALSKGSMDNITCIVINLRKYVSRMLAQDAIRAKLSQDELRSLGLLKMESGEFQSEGKNDTDASTESVEAESKPYDNGPQGLFTKSKLYFVSKASKPEPRTLPRSSSTGGRIRTPDIPSEPPSPVASSTPSAGSAFNFSRSSSGAAVGGIASLASDTQRAPSQGLFENGHLKSLDGYDVLDSYVSSTAYAKNKAQQSRSQPITIAPQNSPIASSKRPDSARNQLAALPKRPSSRSRHDQYEAKTSPIAAFGMNTSDVDDVPRASIHSPINTTRHHVDRMVLPERKVRNPNYESDYTSTIRKSYSLG